ncbi:MAG: DMT family transporter [Chloroflexi bacterium]|nr:DMT family transporter [Chloroflexota bacterium]
MKLNSFLWILLLAAIWGPSFLFIKVTVHEVPPITLVFGRVALASLVLLVVLRLRGGRMPKERQFWLRISFMGLFANALPFVLFSWGEQFVDSAMASILNGTTPLFTVVLAHYFTTDDRMTSTKLFGTMLGFFGLVLLVVPSLLEGFQLKTFGLLALVVAAVCYGVTIVFSRKYLSNYPPLVAPTGQLGMAALFLLPMSLIFEQPGSLAMPSLPALASWVALSLLGTAVAFIVYYHILSRFSASDLSMVTYLIPIFGIILGVLVLGERPGWNAYVGCGLILLGVMAVNGVFSQLSLRLNTAKQALTD